MMAEVSKYQFKSVQLLKDQSLGIGSYGAVCKAKCDDLLCAAKIIHPTLFDPTALQQVAPQKEHRLPIRRFEQECEFMSAIRHPNIVQYLGMFRDTDTRLPGLLMELMDNSLTHFLESSTQPIPYHIQVNICHDVSLALSFLHSNKIIHRDLSSNNVLLISNVRAKVTDFGMARLGDINPQATRFTGTMCPGTDVYMPPEAVQDKPVYTEKIDCFSFGVIIVQTLTRQFPKPGDRLQEVELNHPGLPKRKLLMQIPEVERRQNHISQIDPNHSLLPIALDCLKDKDSKRPSAHQLCERVADLKGMPKYRDSARAVEDSRDEVIRSQATSNDEKDRTISAKEEEIQRLRQQLQQERDQANRRLEERVRQLQQTKDQQLEEKERQLNQQMRQLRLERNQAKRQLEDTVRQMQQESDQNLQKIRKKKERQFGPIHQQLETSEQVQFERQIAELEQQVSQREQQKTKASSREKELTSFKLTWRKGKSVPCEMSRWYDAVVDGSMVYIRSRGTVKLYSYNNITRDIYNWSLLPYCVQNGSIAVIKGCLTIIGGGSPPNYSNELLSFTAAANFRGSIRSEWTQKFPPMPTKRESTTSLCTGTALIVAGGRGGSGVLSTVEVMNTETHQWFTAANLPQLMYRMSTTICGDQLYMLGGLSKNHYSIKSVYTCSLSTLLRSCVIQQMRAPLAYEASVWKQLTDLSVKKSTCQSLHGRLLAIGGIMDSGKCSTAVHMYNSTTNSWEIISHMTTGRCDCFTAVLPDNRLMVVGGEIEGGSLINIVELASVSMC